MIDQLVRGLIGRVIRHLLGTIVTLSGRVGVDVPQKGLLGPLLRGRVDQIVVTAASLQLGDLPLDDALVYLSDVGFRPAWHEGPTVRVTAGTGRVEATLAGAEVRRRAGMSRWLAFEGGQARVGRSWLTLGLRPVIDGQRIRLAPTPFAMTLPELPDGIDLREIHAHEDALHLTASIDLARLMRTENPGLH